MLPGPMVRCSPLRSCLRVVPPRTIVCLLFLAPLELTELLMNDTTDYPIMVDDLGSGVREGRLSRAESWVKDFPRFRVLLSEQEVLDQVARQARLISTVSLPPFSPNNEREFEKWVDEAAARVNGSLVGPVVFREAWILSVRRAAAVSLPA